MIKVEIVKFVDSWQPGWVEGRFTDVLGNEHRFVEKVPVLTADYLDENSSYPQRGFIGCTILNEKEIEGNKVFEVDTSQPDGIESTEGIFRFTVAADSLTET